MLNMKALSLMIQKLESLVKSFVDKKRTNRNYKGHSKSSKPRQKGVVQSRQLSLFLYIASPNINTLGEAMFIYCNPLPQHASTTQIVSKLATRKVRFSLGNKSKSDRAESGEFGGS